MPYSRYKGFTLVELLVVIGIIGLLSSIAVVSLSGARNKAVGTKVAADLRTIQTALELYAADNNTYPASAAWTSINIGSYMPQLPTAPTGATYFYCVSSNAYLVAAYGVVPAVEPGGLSQVNFNDNGAGGAAPLSAVKCNVAVPSPSADCSQDTIYCLSNTTSKVAFQ